MCILVNCGQPAVLFVPVYVAVAKADCDSPLSSHCTSHRDSACCKYSLYRKQDGDTNGIFGVEIRIVCVSLWNLVFWMLWWIWYCMLTWTSCCGNYGIVPSCLSIENNVYCFDATVRMLYTYCLLSASTCSSWLDCRKCTTKLVLLFWYFYQS
jgi:hypothetical protein